MVQWIIVGGAAGIFVAVLGVIFGWALLPPIIRKQVDENVILIDGTEQFDRWVDIPQPLSFKVHIFNVTNAEDVQNGALPIVNEIGPYVYDQHRKKTIKSFSFDKSAVTYTQQQSYVFNKEASAPYTEDDHIVVLNMHLNAVLQIVDDEMSDFLSLVNNNIQSIFGDKTKTMFLTTTPRAYLFEGIPFCENVSGIAQLICLVVKQRNLSTIRNMPDGSVRFSFFNHKNVTHEGVFQVDTGIKDALQITNILKINSNSYIRYWLNSGTKTSVCNMINGTDAASFPPHRTPGGSMFIYSTDVCRSVEIFYQQPSIYKGVNGLKFVTGDNFLNEIGPEYSTECFCIDRVEKIPKKDNGCLYKGALDLTTCQGAPVILTLPHMLGADPIYTTVKGMNPDAEKHLTYANIEPYTGFPLEGGKRVQLNMFLRKIDKIDITQNLQTCLMPAVWVEEGVALNDEMLALLNRKLLTILIIVDILIWSMIAAGIAFLIAMIILYVYKKKKTNKVHP